MLKNFVNKIIAGDFPTPNIPQWIAAFTAIIFIRLFLEQFSNQSPFGILESDPRTITHVFLFFLAVIICISLIVSIFTKQKSGKVITLALYGLPVIWLAPTLDLLISGERGSSLAYMFEPYPAIIFNFLSFFGPIKAPGITTGLHIELFIILCAIGWYVWNKRKNILSTLGAVFASYVFIFCALSLPGIVFTIFHIGIEGSAQNAVLFMNETILNSNIPGNIIHNTLAYKSTARLFDIGFDTIVSQLFFLISFIALLVWSWFSYQDIFKKILLNARVERVLFYTSLILLGIFFAQRSHFNSLYFTWIDWVGLVVLIISWFSAWMYAVHTNDLYDTDIDEISNPERPLIKDKISPEVFRDIGLIWLATSLMGSYIVGYYPFFMCIIFTGAYYIYSAPPLRLKRIPLLSSFLIALACLATILAGFFFVSQDKLLSVFPSMYAIGIVVIFTLGVNIRDIKDIAGDKASHVPTLPVLFGKNGKKIVGGLVAFSFVLAPYFLPFFASYIISVPAAIVAYFLCVREPYNERYIFALFFSYTILSVLSSFI